MNFTRTRILVALGVFLFLAATFAALGKLRTGPPRTITFAAGSSSGAYYAFAKKYQELLAQSGLEVVVLETKGSRENLELLESGRADIGFVQSGMRGKSEAPLYSLGSMFFEPLWVFVRQEEPSRELLELKSKKISIGNPGSGTRDVAQALLDDNKLQNKVETFDFELSEAVAAILAGELDAVFVVGSPSIPAIKTLAHSPGIVLMNFSRAKAYSRYHHSLSDVTLYQGMLNLAEDIPSEDQHLVAASANLVVTESFHYALVTLVLQTAREIHKNPGPFHTYDQFPNPQNTSFPLVHEADQFYRRGPSFFYRHVPFYVAASLDRLLIILIPLATLLLPLGKIVPPIYGWIFKRRLYKRQSKLAEIELNRDELSAQEQLRQLDELESEIVDVKTLPPAYQNDVFLLQLRIERVREQLVRDKV